ncbi:MAG: IS21-like element helper ATPase IstB [Gemmatimonadota bacterium]|nr:IS21-like element helper ATPase IstB [Gemmatimonadota bacterium]
MKIKTAPTSSAVSVSLSASLLENLRSLRLAYLEAQAVTAAQQAARNGRGHLAYLEELIAAEAALLHDRSVTRRIAAARFPVIKTMAGWNWSWPRKINRMQVEHLLRLDFLCAHANVILLGGTGLGKTHLASALGHAACLQKHSVLFASTIDVVNRLSAALSNDQLAREIKRYEAPRVLILDELGCLPLDKRGAELLFQVISKRYERGSTIITTNIAFKEWPRIFAGDATMTSALLDRLLHHAETVVLEGESYRSPKAR